MYRSYRSKLWPFTSCNFSSLMSSRRFELILRFLHLNNSHTQLARDQPGLNKLYKICPLLNQLLPSFQTSYTPEQLLSVDESMAAFKGQLSFLQYLPKKPHKWGMKAWVLQTHPQNIPATRSRTLGKKATLSPQAWDMEWFWNLWMMCDSRTRVTLLSLTTSILALHCSEISLGGLEPVEESARIGVVFLLRYGQCETCSPCMNEFTLWHALPSRAWPSPTTWLVFNGHLGSLLAVLLTLLQVWVYLSTMRAANKQVQAHFAPLLFTMVYCDSRWFLLEISRQELQQLWLDALTFPLTRHSSWNTWKSFL